VAAVKRGRAEPWATDRNRTRARGTTSTFAQFCDLPLTENSSPMRKASGTRLPIGMRSKCKRFASPSGSALRSELAFFSGLGGHYEYHAFTIVAKPELVQRMGSPSQRPPRHGLSSNARVHFERCTAGESGSSADLKSPCFFLLPRQKPDLQFLHENRVGKHFSYLALSLMDKVEPKIPDVV
jgi:hypothetical protein